MCRTRNPLGQAQPGVVSTGVGSGLWNLRHSLRAGCCQATVTSGEHGCLAPASVSDPVPSGPVLGNPAPRFASQRPSRRLLHQPLIPCGITAHVT